MSVFLGSSVAKSGKKMSAWFVYFKEILVKVLLYYKAATYSWATQEKCISIADIEAFKATICITNISELLFKAVLASFHLLISFTCLIVGKTSTAK